MGKDYEDYFDGDHIPEEEKTEEITPQQKEAKEVAEVTIERRHNKLKTAMMTIVVLIVIGLASWIAVIFWVPFVSEAQQRGAITQVRLEGFFFKTYEGQMVTEEYIADTSKIYQRDFIFSIENDSIAKDLMELQATGRRVTLTYKEYRGTLPWRGSSNKIITGYKLQ